MLLWLVTGSAIAAAAAAPQVEDNLPLGDRAVRILADLVRLDTTNPPGNESRVADYLKQVAAQAGIPAETLGADPRRLNFIARLKGSGKNRPLLLFSQSDTATVDRTQWKADPFSGEVREGFVYGRGASDSKALLAAELAVLIELKRRNITLDRDLILCVEADGAGSSGMQWLLQNHWPKIEAEFAFGEGGYSFESEGRRVFLVQTAEKLPLRIQLTARGAVAGSPGRAESPIVRLSRALVRLSEAEPAIRLTPGVRRYFREIARLDANDWLLPYLARLENPATAAAAAREIRAKNPEFDALLHDTIQPLSLRANARGATSPAGVAEAIVEVRRLPGESREEILGRLRGLVFELGVEVSTAPGPQTPVADSSSLNSAAFRAMQGIFNKLHPEDIVAPYLALQPTGNAYLRSRNVAVYGLPLFREPSNAVADEKIQIPVLQEGVEVLWQIVLQTAGGS